MSEKANVPAVQDPYAVHQDNMPAPVGANPMALALRTPVGKLVLKPDSQFLALASAAGMNPAALVLELASVAARKPEILKCAEESVIAFMLDAAKLNLTIGRGIYPVPIKGRLEGWVGYKGAKELACRGGAIRDCWAAVHFEGDDFEMEEVPIPTVTRHKFGPNRGNMAKALGVYATLLYPGGKVRHKHFTKAKIESYRKRNPSATKSDSPWNTSPEEMWLAKAILHAVSDLPHSSPQLAHLREIMEREESTLEALPAAVVVHPGGEEVFDGPSFDEEPAATYTIEDKPRVMPLEEALAVQVKGKNGQRQPLAEIRNSGLEAWLEWARTKLQEDLDSDSLTRIATACARVLDARRTGEHPEPAKAEAA